MSTESAGWSLDYARSPETPIRSAADHEPANTRTPGMENLTQRSVAATLYHAGFASARRYPRQHGVPGRTTPGFRTLANGESILVDVLGDRLSAGYIQSQLGGYREALAEAGYRVELKSELGPLEVRPKEMQ